MLPSTLRSGLVAASLLSATVLALAQNTEAGSLEQAYQDALKLQKGDGVKADLAAAAEALRRAADAGHSEAACRYAEAVVAARGVGRNYSVANVYAEKAASAGVTACMVIYGDSFQVGRGGIAKDGAIALQWYEKAARAGDVQGMYEAGEALRTGNGVPADVPRAVTWLKPAAERNHPEAMTSLGYVHATNKGELADRGQGLRLLRAAAEHGSLGAQIWLGELLAFGSDGITADPAEGLKWLKAAAARKNNRAYLAVARVYRDGLGVEADWKEAIHWADFARQNGNWSGATFIGRLYAKGGPRVAQSRQDAFNYFKHAYGAGETEALGDLKRLLPYKTTTELMSIADLTAAGMAGNGIAPIVAQGDNGRRYRFGGRIVNLQAALQTNGDVHLTVQGSDMNILKAFYKAYLADNLQQLDGHQAWLYPRAQILD